MISVCLSIYLFTYLSVCLSVDVWCQFKLVYCCVCIVCCIFYRYGEQGGAGPGGAWVSDAVSGRMPRLHARAHAELLA